MSKQEFRFKMSNLPSDAFCFEPVGLSKLS